MHAHTSNSPHESSARTQVHTCAHKRPHSEPSLRTQTQEAAQDANNEEDRPRFIRNQTYVPKMLGFLLDHMYAGTPTAASLKGFDLALYEALVESGLPVHLVYVKACVCVCGWVGGWVGVNVCV